jgi:crotonobetainyl-CoA:carnitine CoA-transferase CaiB-like acyl-CoA transferase
MSPSPLDRPVASQPPPDRVWDDTAGVDVGRGGDRADAGAAGALAGLRVADFSRVLAGPYATMLLADLGAQVVKVERPPHGDDTRSWGPPFAADGTATYFQSVNRNKRSVWWDLADPAAAAAARELAITADVLVENLAPGTMHRFGLGYEDLVADNPGLVYASVTGFGAGAGAGLPGYDLLVQAMGGLMSITGTDAEHPTKVGVALVDVVTGLHATVGILAALAERQRSGRGQRVEVSLLGSTLSALVNQAQAVVGASASPHPMGNAHPSIAPYETFPTAEGVLALAVGNDRQFAALCGALDLDLHEDPRFATNPSRVANRPALVARLATALAGRSAVAWAAILTEAGVPAGPVHDIPGALALAERLGLDPVVDAGGVPTIAHPVRLSRTPATYRLPPPGPAAGPGSS